MKLTGAWILAFLLLSPTLQAQRGRRGTPGGGGISAPPLGVVITFHGILKHLTKKEILLLADDNHIMTIRRVKKTKFLDSDQEIKSTDIDLESKITVYASEDHDLKMLALAVKVDPGQDKHDPATRK
jgi:hypothetical protein